MSLSEKAMLVRLSISQWSARKYDKKVTDRINQEYNARDAGRFNKVLIALDTIKEISKIAGEARQYHYEQTLPWEDEGLRILPAENYIQYMAEMRKYKAKFEIAVQSFIEQYPALVEDARQRLTGMFDENDYPSQKNLQYKYGFEVTVTPLPVASDFRVSLSDEEIRKIQSDIEKRLKQIQENATMELWRRLYEPVKHMAEKLSETDGIFRDTLISNIRDICELLPRLNITNDPELEKMRKEVEEKLCSYTPHRIRSSRYTRKQAAEDAKKILETMAGYKGKPTIA